MRKLTAGFILGFIASTGLAWASLIPSPPLTEDKEIRSYLNKIYNNLGRFTVVTSDPNGSRRGRKGDTVWWNDSGTYRIRVNVDDGQGGTTWVANS